jgi:hypothetical protein
MQPVRQRNCANEHGNAAGAPTIDRPEFRQVTA